MSFAYSRPVVALLGLFCLPLVAQEFRAGVSGVVRDPQGAVIASAEIVARNLETNKLDSTTSSSAGYYALPVLHSGFYTITASAQGFKKAVKENLELRVGDKVQQDFILELGAVSETITITGESELLQTATASRGQVVNAESVRDLPTLGRNPFLLGVITSGVQYNPGLESRAARPFDAGGSNATEGMSINGGRTGASDVLLDGVPNTSTETTGPANSGFIPSPDATQEFKIQTNNYDAQYGRSAGGVFSVTLKSGTNRFHGALYEYFRHDKLNANQFELNRAGTPKTSFRWNQPGVEIDGPVRIPKIYNGRDKTFFMYSWEAVRSSIPFPQTLSVPFPEQKLGDFSNLRQANGQPILIYDPATTVETSPGSGVYTRQAFPNNIIPADRLNPVATKIVSYIPNPTLPGINQNFISAPNPRKDVYDQNIVRIDQVLNQKNRFFSRYIRGNRHEVNGDGGFAGPASQWYLHQRLNQGGNFDLTTVLSPTTLLTSRVGYTRHKFDILLYASGFNPATLGFPSSLLAQIPDPLYFPTIALTDYSTFGAGRSSGNQTTFSEIWSASETVNKTVASHSIKLGGEFRVNIENQNSPASNFGSFSTTRAFTQKNPVTSDAASGNSLASFLLGMPTSGSVPINPALAYSYRYYSGFVQDDWRLSKSISVNLGLRWDMETPVTERFDRQNAGFDFNSVSPLQAPGLNLKGGLLFTSQDHRLPYPHDWNNFQPRAGLAWKLSPKTVLRTGYGLSYLATFATAGNTGFQLSTPYVATDGAVIPNQTRISNPYPDGIRQPYGRSLGLGTLVGQSISFTNPDRVIPKVHQYSFGFEHELPWRTVVELTYAGSRSRSLETSKQIDALTADQFAQFGATLNGTVANPFAGLLPGTGLNAATTTRQQLLRPYPQFTGITENRLPYGQSWYNSLQMRAEKRLSTGLQFLVTYTFSKSLEATGYLNDQDPIDKPARVLSSNDATHRVVVSGGWSVPIFRNARGITAILFKGWQANAIAIFQTGVPLGAPSGWYSTGIDPSLPAEQRTQQRYFNTCVITTAGVRQNCASADEPVAFIQQQPFTLRTLSTAFPTIRPPRVPNQDVSLFKSFPIHERLQMQFRAEAFNLSNSPQLGNPSTSLTASTAGQAGFTQANDPRNIQLALRLQF